MEFQRAVDVFNALEAVLWTGLAVWILFRRNPPVTRFRRGAWFVALFLFGLSDVVEVQTGAFWRPWWLLVWKGACLVSFALLFYSSSRRRK